MPSGNSTTDDCLTIHIEASDLPDDKETRATLSTDLGTAIRDVLAEHEIDPENLRCIPGHAYATISTHCPVCRDKLELTEFTLDTSNGGHATARCKCGWNGTAIYRLIDLHEHSDELIPDPEEVSSVHRYDIDPQYTPY